MNNMNNQKNENRDSADEMSRAGEGRQSGQGLGGESFGGKHGGRQNTDSEASRQNLAGADEEEEFEDEENMSETDEKGEEEAKDFTKRPPGQGDRKETGHRPQV